MLEIIITVLKKNIDIQSSNILIEILKDIRVEKGKLIIINVLFIIISRLISIGIAEEMNISMKVIIIIESITPQVIILLN